MLLRTLIASTNPELVRTVRTCLARLDTDLLLRDAESSEGMWEGVRGEPVDLLLVERGVLGPDVGSTIEGLRTLPDPPEIVVFSNGDDEGLRAADLAAGALAVLGESIEPLALRGVLETIVERRRDQAVTELLAEVSQGDSEPDDFSSSSPSMQRFLETVKRVIQADSSLLMLGETGVGKEHLARKIHARSHRGEGPFVALNCAALPESLLESELFGHVAGAFTGATKARRGYFELAHGGSLFLDEIAELPNHVQVKLLRALQEREIRPVGAERAITVDVRVIAATNRDLKQALERKEFRPDLYYRLGVVTLTLPPLRERPEDIPQLVSKQIEHFRALMNRPVFGASPEAMEALVSYSWPGNVRELINVVERAVLLTTGEEITAADLPEELVQELIAGREYLRRTLHAGSGERGVTTRTYKELRREVLGALDEQYFDALLRETRGRVGKAAARAGITARALYEKMKSLGLEKELYRGEPTDEGASSECGPGRTSKGKGRAGG